MIFTGAHNRRRAQNGQSNNSQRNRNARSSNDVSLFCFKLTIKYRLFDLLNRDEVETQIHVCHGRIPVNHPHTVCLFCPPHPHRQHPAIIL